MNGPFEIEETALEGVFILRRVRRGDARGWLERIYDADALAEAGFPGPVRQVNLTHTGAQGTLRGMHLQYAPALEMKLVSCIAGRVRDVALDLRAGAPTYLSHVALDLDPGGGAALLIPPGVAHGFQSLEPCSAMLYVHSADYAPAHEGGVRATDPALGLCWPLPVGEMSARDRALPLAADQTGVVL